MCCSLLESRLGGSSARICSPGSHCMSTLCFGLLSMSFGTGLRNGIGCERTGFGCGSFTAISSLSFRIEILMFIVLLGFNCCLFETEIRYLIELHLSCCFFHLNVTTEIIGFIFNYFSLHFKSIQTIFVILILIITFILVFILLPFVSLSILILSFFLFIPLPFIF